MLIELLEASVAWLRRLQYLAFLQADLWLCSFMLRIAVPSEVPVSLLEGHIGQYKLSKLQWHCYNLFLEHYHQLFFSSLANQVRAR